MKLSTAKRRINKTLDELCKSVVDDWYANFKNGYIKGYEDARQGKSPMYTEAYKVADTPQTEKRIDRDGDVWEWRGDAWYCISQANTPQTDCNGCKFVGTYDTEFPCANCSRKTKDYYAKDEPQTNKEIVLDPSFAELSDEQFVEAMKLIEPQTDCPWK